MANLLSTTVTGTINSSGNVTAPTFVGSLSGNASTASDSNLLDGLDSGSFLRSDANDTFTGTITMGTQKALVANNYGRGVYGLYNSGRYQHVWSMGTDYNLTDNGTGSGNLYGLSWTHTNVGGESKSGLSHQLLLMMNGTTYTALGNGIWTQGTITTASHGTSADWNTAYGWGNHAGLYDSAGTGAAQAGVVNTRIDEEILPAIGAVTLASLGYTGATNANYITNNNQLTNGAGYLTSSNDRNYITDSRGAARAPSYYNDRYAQWDFQNVADTGVGGDGWHALLTVSKWSSFDPSHRQEQLIFSGDHLWRRTAISDADWGENKKVWDSGNLDAFVGASVSNDTITFTKASGGTVAVTTSDANTNTWRGIDDTPVNGQTAESISSNWAYDHVNASNPHGTTASDVGADAAGSADAVNSRIDTEVLPAIGAVTLATLGYTGATNANYITNNNQLTNGAGYITDGNTGWNNSYGFIASGDTQEPGAWGSATKFKSSGQIADADSGSHSLQLISDNGNDAFMALHVSGDYAVFFGLDGASNRLHTGGWSAGATSYQIFDTRDFSAADVANGVTAHGWGNHASAGYATEDYANTSALSYSSLVNTRIDEEVLPAIPTNNNELTNGAGYLTSVPTTLSGNRTIGGDLTVSGNQVITAGSNADVKFSVWSDTTYGIGMTSGVTYGGLNDYAMTFCMNNDSDRGFWWGYSGQTKSAGAMSLTTGGILTVASTITAGGDITAFSDARVKENIETIDNALDKVTQLRGVEYNRIGAEERSIGVIAQEVQEVLPEVVREGQDGMLSVAYGNITGVLIEAIKEQQKQIEELKAQLDGLTK